MQVSALARHRCQPWLGIGVSLQADIGQMYNGVTGVCLQADTGQICNGVRLKADAVHLIKYPLFIKYFIYIINHAIRHKNIIKGFFIFFRPVYIWELINLFQLNYFFKVFGLLQIVDSIIICI